MKKSKYLKISICLLLVLVTAIQCISCDSKGTSSFTVEYQNARNGRLEGTLIQQVDVGGSTSQVTAIPNEGYMLERWSDGLTEATRYEQNVSKNMLIYPIFKPIPFSVTYRGICDNRQIYSHVLTNVSSTSIDFNASVILPGYKFLYWSDKVSTAKRSDGCEADGKVITAYYQKLESVLPVVKIQTENNSNITSKDVYINCSVDLTASIDEQQLSNVSAQIRGRGNYTWNYCKKKSYRLKFDEKRSVLGSENKDRNWVLLSNGFDNSLTRNYIGLELGERFKTVSFSSMHEFIELYINGNYCGVYLFCDLIETGSGRVDLNDDLSDPESLAFLVERDTYSKKGEGVLDFDYFILENDYDWSFNIHFPDPDAPTYDPDIYVTYIKNYLYDALDAIGTKDWEYIQQYIDVESFAEMYIIHECMLNLDVGWNSFYMYKDKGGKLCLGPPWDFDLSAGNYNAIRHSSDKSYTDAYPAYDVDFYDQLWGLKQNTWFRRLVRVPEFVELLQLKLDELDSTIKEVYSLADPNNANGLYKKYGVALEKNMEHWGVFTNEGPTAVKSLKTITEQQQYLYDWLMERLRVVRTYYGMPPEKQY